MKLQGKIAVVTGAGNGIGRSLAIGLSREGAKIAVADIDYGSAQDTATKVEDQGGQALPVKVDISDHLSVKEMTEQILKDFNQIDILVNNAGITSSYPLLELPEAEWDRVLNTNLKGYFLCVQNIAPVMLRRQTGSIINISSVAAEIPTPDTAHYGAAKAGMMQLTKSMALALAPTIRVNAIEPGTIRTSMNVDILSKPGVEEEKTRAVPLKRIGMPEDLVGPVVFFASDESSYVTGTSLLVDGGVLLVK